MVNMEQGNKLDLLRSLNEPSMDVNGGMQTPTNDDVLSPYSKDIESRILMSQRSDHDDDFEEEELRCRNCNWRGCQRALEFPKCPSCFTIIL